jgi:hypothetical protein
MAGTITSGWTTQFKVDLAKAVHNFTAAAHVFKLALLKPESNGPLGYSIATNYGAATTDYDNVGTDEVPNGSGYTTGGWTGSLTNVTPTSTGTTAFWSWTGNPQWTTATFDTGGAVIYNSSAGNLIVAVVSWGGIRSLSAGTGTVTWPTNDATTAPMRLL